MLIGLTGNAGSGKDTAADHIAETYQYARLAFATPLREMLKAGFGFGDEVFSAAQKNTVIPEIGKSPRQLMQTLGTEWGRAMVADDIWIRLAALRIHYFYVRGIPTVITDVRFENEAALVRNTGGIIIRLVRDTAAPVNQHVSEAGIALTENDFTIENHGGIQALHKAIDAALETAWSRAPCAT